jgi:hypothetical protein
LSAPGRGKEDRKVCIAIVKEEGVEMPSKELLRTCWENNPDGAGFMFYRDGAVRIRKGYMKFKHLWRALRQEGLTVNDLVSIHFRIATSGGVSQENTHPFPVSTSIPDLKALQLKAEMGIVHNGIIDIEPMNLDDSDTQAFIYSVLAPLKDQLNRPSISELISMATAGSKLAILDASGFSFFGRWIDDKETKLIFSNEGYMRQKVKTAYYPGMKWDFVKKAFVYETAEVMTAQSLHEVMEYDCFICNRVTPEYELNDEGVCASCAEEYFNVYRRE